MIDTEALRKKVIDLAIQGKLTQQLPEDGDAEDLYVQIQKEKAKHIKEGKIKKEKPLPGITDEEIPFEIPSNWKWIRLYDISETNIGLTYHPENIVDDGTIVLRSNNIVNGAFDYSDLVRVNCTVRDSQYIRENDILICSRNGSKRLVGKCAIYDGTYGDVSFGAFMAILRTPYFKYIYFYLLTDCFRRNFSSDDTKQINQVTQDILKKAIVPFPPISEQKRIVEKLNDVLAQIDIIDALQQQYESDREVLKGKIIDAGIRGMLTEQLPEDGNAEDLYAHIQKEKANLIKEGKIKKEKPLSEISDDEVPFEIPSNWKWVRWGDISERIQYGYNAPAMEIGRIKMVRISDIQDGKVNWDSVPYCDITEESISEYLLHKNDILFARTGGTVGKSYLVSEVPEDSIYAGYLIRTSYSSMICAQYMKLFMDSELYWKQLQSGTIATAQPNCNGKTLSKMIVPLPPSDEQKRISERISVILSLIT